MEPLGFVSPESLKIMPLYKRFLNTITPFRNPEDDFRGGTATMAAPPQDTSDYTPDGQDYDGSATDARSISAPPPVPGGADHHMPGMNAAVRQPMPAPPSGVPEGAEPDQGPPMPPAMATGAPKPPMSAAAQDLEKLRTMEAPPKPKNNLWQTIGQTALKFTKFGPAAEQIIHPKYSADMRDYGRKRDELSDQINEDAKVENTESLGESRLSSASAREQAALSGFHKIGGLLLPSGSAIPPGMTHTISPVSDSPKYAGAIAVYDPHHDKFKVNEKQSAMTNGALNVGDWLPLTELPTLVKGGLDKADKGEFVDVSPAYAASRNVAVTPRNTNPDGTVSIPRAVLIQGNTANDKPEPKGPKFTDATYYEMRAQNKSTGVPEFDQFSPKEATAALDRLKPRPQSNITNFNLSPEAKAMLADQALAGGTVPSFGSRGGQAVADIYNQAAKSKPDANLAAAKQDYAATGSAIKDQVKSFARVKTSEGTAIKNLDLADSISKKVDRTGSPIINKYLLFLKGDFGGDDDTILLNNAVETAANEYAGVVSAGSGGGVAATDSNRDHARAMLRSAMAKGTFTKAVALMKQEMGNRKASFQEGLTELRGSRGNTSQSSGGSSAKSDYMKKHGLN
jgi:hypothetical protein